MSEEQKREGESKGMNASYLEPAEVSLMGNAATNLRDKLLIHLLFHLGCRVSEAISLTVDDIDLDHGTITIQHLKFRMNISCPQCGTRLGKAHTFCPRCGIKVEQTVAKQQEHRRVRILPLDNDTLALLKDYIKRGGPVTKDGKQMIFGINRHRAWQVVNDCAARASLGSLVNPVTGRTCGVSPHRLRDAFAVHAMKKDDSGDGLRMLQEHLGHASFDTTARYRKIAGEEHRQWYRKLWEEGKEDA
jgi:integrase/recombinase XerD